MEKQNTTNSEDLQKSTSEQLEVVEKDVKPKKKRRFRITKKRFLILILLALLVGGGSFAYYYFNQEEDDYVYYHTTPEPLRMTGWINKVYDGDTSLNPSYSIFNRVVKVELSLELNQYGSVTITNSGQVKLIANGSSYYPLKFETFTVSDSYTTRTFYFELNRDLNPEAVVISDESIESDLEILINVDSQYYSTNTALNLVFDDNTNKEFVSLKDKLQAYVDGTSELIPANLANIDIVANVPQNYEVSYYNNKHITYDPYTQYPQYETGAKYYYGSCYSIDTESLLPTDEDANCELYKFSYSVESDSKLIGVTRSVDIYKNSYPSSLVNTLDSHDVITKIESTILGRSVTITEIKSSYSIDRYVVIKIDSGDIYVITTSKSTSYSSQIPVEITDLENQLMFKVLESLEYLDQEDEYIAPATTEPAVDDTPEETQEEENQDELGDIQVEEEAPEPEI